MTCSGSDSLRCIRLTFHDLAGKEVIESAIGPKTRAILAPNLIGNCPDWDVIRDIADRHDLLVIEDTCDVLGDTFLRGTRTGTRADIGVTSFAVTHSITAAGGGRKCRLGVMREPTHEGQSPLLGGNGA